MVGILLIRGMIVGLVAGLLCFAFLKVAGEPSVDRAIAFESAMDAAKDKAMAEAASAKGTAMPMDSGAPELFSRDVQAGLGLFTGVMVYGASFGGLFALAYALAFGRMGAFGPKATSALLATAGFVAIYVVPSLKYPANPPSIGAPESIGLRTAFYFAMIAVSLAAMIGAGTLRLRLDRRLGAWNASLLAVAAYVLAMIATALAFPTVNEVPDQFPAVVLWQFRIAAMGGQLVLWTVLGLAFGAWMERAGARQAAPRLGATAF